MTIKSGRGWRLAPSLAALEDEANRVAPRRSTASDGSIGDAAHRHRVSDHNPSHGVVHAIDLTHDPKGGFDAHAHGRAIAARRDGRVKYLISQRRIWEPGSGWRPYTGENPHDRHLHVSVWDTPAAENDRSVWLPWAGAPAPAPTPIPAPAPISPPVSVPSNVPTPVPTFEEDDVIVRNTEDGSIWAVSSTHMHHLTPDQWQQRSGVEHPPIVDMAAISVWSLALAGRQVV